MSDFDEDAERERLREKYEQTDREATERMSELLLQGATMTNAHCGECGDPIFRYEGQEFCPTCEEVVGDGTDDGDATAGGADADATDAVEADAGAGDAVEADTGDADAAEPGTTAHAETGDQEGTARTDSPGGQLPERRERADVPDRDRQPRGAPRRPDPPVRREEREERRTAEPARESGDDLADARESLRRTLVRFAREAERAEDPRRAREHLEAASEAADALATLAEIR